MGNYTVSSLRRKPKDKKKGEIRIGSGGQALIEAAPGEAALMWDQNKDLRERRGVCRGNI